MREVLVTSVPGLEDVVLEELRRVLSPAEYRVLSPGKILLSLSDASFESLVRQLPRLRSVERAILVLLRREVGEARLAEVERELTESLRGVLPEYASPYLSYSVHAKRSGEHEFTSLDLARVTGEAVRKVMGGGAPVNLECPDLRLYVELRGSELILGVDVTGPRPLHEREYRAYLHPSSLNPIVAYAMVVLARVSEGHRVLDPMCGSGTILIECGLARGGVELYGVDINPEYLRGASLNVRRAGLEGRVRLLLGDATRLEELFPPSYFDRVISNLPYGIRIGSPYPLRSLYHRFLRSVRRVVREDGLLVLLTARGRLLERAVAASGFEVVGRRTIEMGGLYPRIYLLRP